MNPAAVERAEERLGWKLPASYFEGVLASGMVFKAWRFFALDELRIYAPENGDSTQGEPAGIVIAINNEIADEQLVLIGEKVYKRELHNERLTFVAPSVMDLVTGTAVLL